MLKGILLFLTAVSAAFAQGTGSATLVGTITDSSGSVIPGAKVIAVNTETSFVSETTASAEGAYYVPYLTPGNYRVTIETRGFKKYVREGITLRTNEMRASTCRWKSANSRTL